MVWWVAEYDNDVGIDCANDCSTAESFPVLCFK